MDLPLQTVASEIAKTLLNAGAKLFGERLQKRFRESGKLEEYLQTVGNRVSYFVTYRPARQHVEAAYVRPLLISGSLSLSHIPAPVYEQYIHMVETAINDGVPLSSLQYALPAAPGVDILLRDIRYVPLEDLVSDYRNAIILSEPGGGKTSLLSYLCYSRLRLAMARLPIFLTSQHLQDETLRFAIDHALEPIDLDLRAAMQLGSGVALYIDGLDELAPTQYKNICHDLGTLVSESPGMSVTASCRSAAYHNELSFLSELSIVPFDSPRSRAFVRAWFKGVAHGPSAENLISDVDKSSRLTELATQPLLLCLMCNAYRRYLNISRRQSTLFEQCINALLWQWDADRAVKRTKSIASLDLQKQTWLHSRIATHMHEAQQRFANRSFVLDVLRRELPHFGIDGSHAVETLDDMCSHNAILAQFTLEAYGFSHLALQEFLAAKWYASELRWSELVEAERLCDPWWQNVIALSCALLSDSSNMINAIRDLREVPEIERLKVLTDCIRHDPIVAPDIRNAVLRKVLDWYHNGSVEQHDSAAYMLVGIEDDWGASAITTSLAARLPTKAIAKLMQRGSSGRYASGEHM